METIAARRRKGSGRRKIEIKKIENKNSLQVTFSKRRTGLFKKAAELSGLCGVDIAVIVQSPAGNIFASGGQASVDSVIDRYLAATSSGSNNADVQSDEDRKKVSEIKDQIGVEKLKERALMESSAKGGIEECWWDRAFDDLDVGELEEYMAALVDLRKNVVAKAEEMAGASSSS